MSVDDEALRRARRVEAALLALAAIAVAAALKLADAFFVPVVVGIFGAYALRPLVAKLAEWHLPEPLAAASVMLMLLAAIVGGAWALRDQAASVLADLPQAAHSIRLRVRALTHEAQPTALGHVKAAAEELKKAASELTTAPAAPVAAPTPDLVDRLTANGVNALGVLTTLGAALAITLFLLAAGNSFRRKLLRVAGNTLRERRVTVEILDDIDRQIQRYLLVMVATNVLLGFVLWGVFGALGIERAAFFAACVAVLHAIPYLGIVFALLLVGTVALLQFGTLAMVLGAMAATAVFSTAIGLFLQNWLQGKASQMNAVAVFISVLFFGWLWGGWGLLLGAPLIAIVRAIASRIESLQAVNEFLSPEAPRKPA